MNGARSDRVREPRERLTETAYPMTVISLASKISPPRIWLVRHGESTWNALGWMQREVAHPPLTPRGVIQAHSAGYQLRDKEIRLVVSSNAVRALQTARAISAIVGAPVHVDARLRERGWARRAADTPPTAVDGITPSHGPTATLEDPSGRVRCVLSDLVHHPGPIVVVTHGDIVCSILDLLSARDATTVLWNSGTKVPNGVVLPLAVDVNRLV